ncbi:MAG TPA: acyltransferase, partial [Pirellulales bacterium]|nr:acyltransferase [Pirellulales bacterium]
MSFRHFFHRLVRKALVAPLVDWYERTHALRQFETLGRLGQGLRTHGTISLGSPANIELGDDVNINSGLVVQGSGHLRVGNHVHMGNDILILTTNHKIEGVPCLPYGHERISKDVVIGDAVWICDRVTITPGVSVGEGAVLSAGAVVNRDVPPLAIVGGSPAQVIRYRDEAEYQRLKEAGQYLGWPQQFDSINGK